MWFGWIFHVSLQVDTFHHILLFELLDSFKFIMLPLQELQMTRKSEKWLLCESLLTWSCQVTIWRPTFKEKNTWQTRKCLSAIKSIPFFLMGCYNMGFGVFYWQENFRVENPHMMSTKARTVKKDLLFWCTEESGNKRPGPLTPNSESRLF